MEEKEFNTEEISADSEPVEETITVENISGGHAAKANPPGRVMLLVCGILMIIGGAINTMWRILLVAGSGVVMGVLGSNSLTGALLGATIIVLLAAIVELVTGIVGCANSRKPEKATFCLVFGIVELVLTIIGLIMSISTYSVPMLIITIVLSVIVPVIYLIGAIKNKQAA